MTKFNVGDKVIYNGQFLTVAEVFEVDPSLPEDETEYICGKENGEEYLRFFKDADLAPYEGSDLQWQREGKAMYAAAQAEIERLKASANPPEPQIETPLTTPTKKHTFAFLDGRSLCITRAHRGDEEHRYDLRRLTDANLKRLAAVLDSDAYDKAVDVYKDLSTTVYFFSKHEVHRG